MLFCGVCQTYKKDCPCPKYDLGSSPAGQGMSDAIGGETHNNGLPGGEAHHNGLPVNQISSFVVNGAQRGQPAAPSLYKPSLGRVSGMDIPNSRQPVVQRNGKAPLELCLEVDAGCTIYNLVEVNGQRYKATIVPPEHMGFSKRKPSDYPPSHSSRNSMTKASNEDSLEEQAPAVAESSAPVVNKPSDTSLGGETPSDSSLGGRAPSDSSLQEGAVSSNASLNQRTSQVQQTSSQSLAEIDGEQMPVVTIADCQYFRLPIQWQGPDPCKQLLQTQPAAIAYPIAHQIAQSIQPMIQPIAQPMIHAIQPIAQPIVGHPFARPPVRARFPNQAARHLFPAPPLPIAFGTAGRLSFLDSFHQSLLQTPNFPTPHPQPVILNQTMPPTMMSPVRPTTMVPTMPGAMSHAMPHAMPHAMSVPLSPVMPAMTPMLQYPPPHLIVQ